MLVFKETAGKMRVALDQFLQQVDYYCSPLLHSYLAFLVCKGEDLFVS
jgi:hypothetical protein